jgi:hypothetical protein
MESFKEKKMEAQEIIDLAQKHVGENASAAICLSDAIACMERGEHEYAKKRAIRSLDYSVGIFHPDYERATQ